MSRARPIDYTGLTYAGQSFVGGFGRALDIGGTFDSYNLSGSPEKIDRRAIASDWYATGADLRRCISVKLKRVGRGKGAVVKKDGPSGGRSFLGQTVVVIQGGLTGNVVRTKTRPQARVVVKPPGFEFDAS